MAEASYDAHWRRAPAEPGNAATNLRDSVPGGGEIYSAAALREMAFTGAISVTAVGPVAWDLASSDWKSSADLTHLQRSEPEIYRRIIENVNHCASWAILKVYGTSQDKGHRIALGLDRVVSWEIHDYEGHPTTSYYGTIADKRRVVELPRPVVSLGDDVAIRMEDEFESIVRYARGLISVEQSRELMIDILILEGERLRLTMPNFVGMLLDDCRWELQTRDSVTRAPS